MNEGVHDEAARDDAAARDEAARDEAARGEVRHCIKCGREIGPEESMCEICNRAGMVPPSATQYHGTMVLAIVVGIAALALAARLATSGVGPFEAQVLRFGPVDGAAEVTFSVANLGTATGTATCRITALDAAGRPMQTRTAQVRVDAAGSETVTESFGALRGTPREMTVDCR